MKYNINAYALAQFKWHFDYTNCVLEGFKKSMKKLYTFVNFCQT
jgi:hypothetical protein